jgi:nicotinate-nucleotide adenylyltransferase
VPQWKQADVLRQQVTLAVLCRGQKGEKDAVLEQTRQLQEQGFSVELVNNQAKQISSTRLRRLLRLECAEPWLPQGVEKYIRAHGLYGTGENCKQLPMDRLEQVVIGLLKPNRVKHVLGCRDTCVELAKRWGADETDAARAGLLHDITKALDGPDQLTLCDAYGTLLDEFSRKYPKTLHALTGSLVARKIFGENEQVVAAICHHTTGKANMSLLEKIVYVADYMEPNRDFPGVERLRQLAFEDLDKALLLGLNMTMQHLATQNAEVSPQSKEAIAWLESHAAP